MVMLSTFFIASTIAIPLTAIAWVIVIAPVVAVPALAAVLPPVAPTRRLVVVSGVPVTSRAPLRAPGRPISLFVVGGQVMLGTYVVAATRPLSSVAVPVLPV